LTCLFKCGQCLVYGIDCTIKVLMLDFQERDLFLIME